MTVWGSHRIRTGGFLVVPYAALAAISIVALAGWCVRRALSSSPHADGGSDLPRRPARLTLRPAVARAFRDRDDAERCAALLREAGYHDCGAFEARELPGVRLRLLVHPEERLRAAWIEFPGVGAWLELSTRYDDGTTSCFSSLPPTGLEPLPGHQQVNVPGSDPRALHARALAERPRGARCDTPPARAARDFERAYADAVAHRLALAGARDAEVQRAA